MLVAIIISPSVGFVGGSASLLLIYWTFRRSRPGRVKPWFRHLQRVSAAYMAFSHGRNDAQKPMGILAMALALYVGGKAVQVPLWVVVSCAAVAKHGCVPHGCAWLWWAWETMSAGRASSSACGSAAYGIP